MFLAFQYGVMYVLSFATIITVFATAIALAVWVVMIACRKAHSIIRRCRLTVRLVDMTGRSMMRVAPPA